MRLGKALEFIKDNTHYEVGIVINDEIVMYGEPETILKVMGMTYYNMSVIMFKNFCSLNYVIIYCQIRNRDI